MSEETPKYKRVLIKLSGEALCKGSDGIYNYDILKNIATVIKKCHDAGVEIAVIVGAGNIWRGQYGKELNMDRVRADHMGMLATAINALALQDAFEKEGLDVRVMTAIDMHAFAEPYIRNKAISHLSKGRITIFGCGLGIPFFSTDTPAVIRAAEIKADIALLAKNVDGIYSSDPKTNPEAIKFDCISHKEILKLGLTATDATSTSFSMDNHIPILVFALSDPMNIYRAIMGENVGTIVE